MNRGYDRDFDYLDLEDDSDQEISDRFVYNIFNAPKRRHFCFLPFWVLQTNSDI